MNIYSVRWMDGQNQEYVRLCRANSELEALSYVDESLTLSGREHIVLKATLRNY